MGVAPGMHAEGAQAAWLADRCDVKFYRVCAYTRDSPIWCSCRFNGSLRVTQLVSEGMANDFGPGV